MALQLFALAELPLIGPGDQLGPLIAATLHEYGPLPQNGDLLVVAQKIVSKAEDRYVDLRSVRPSGRALELAEQIGKDARLVEVILAESVRVVRSRPGLLITEHRLGFVMANAGVDRSNIGAADEGDRVLLLPRDPDASAAALRARLMEAFGVELAVIISDSFGRPWRVGTVGVAIGAAGLPAIVDLRGRPDLFGRPLEVTVIGYADEIAAAASLLMGQADEACPVVLARGLPKPEAPPLPATALVRPAAEDLFR